MRVKRIPTRDVVRRRVCDLRRDLPVDPRATETCWRWSRRDFLRHVRDPLAPTEMVVSRLVRAVVRGIERPLGPDRRVRNGRRGGGAPGRIRTADQRIRSLRRVASRRLPQIPRKPLWCRSSPSKSPRMVVRLVVGREHPSSVPERESLGCPETRWGHQVDASLPGRVRWSRGEDWHGPDQR